MHFITASLASFLLFMGVAQDFRIALLSSEAVCLDIVTVSPACVTQNTGTSTCESVILGIVAGKHTSAQ